MTSPSPLTRQLYIACMKSNIIEMKSLIEEKADPNAYYHITTLYTKLDNSFSPNDTNNVLLHAAIISNNITTIDFVLNELGFKQRIDEPDVNGNTALAIAVTRGQFDVVKHLIKNYSPNINFIIRSSYSTFHILQLALHAGHLELFEYLIEMGVANTIKRSDVLTLLMQGNLALFQYIINEEIFIYDNEDEDGNEAPLLHYAIRSNNIELVDYLIKTLGASIDITDFDGSSSIFIAVAWSNYAMVQHLINEYDASIYDENGLGQSVEEELLCSKTYRRRVEVLTGFQSDFNQDIDDYINNLDIDRNGLKDIPSNKQLHETQQICQYFIDMDLMKFGRFMGSGTHQRTLLVELIDSQPEVAEVLCHQDSDYLKHIFDQQSPRHFFLTLLSTPSCTLSIFRTILNHLRKNVKDEFIRAILNSHDDSGSTPLTLAAMHTTLPIVQYLIQYGLDVNDSIKNYNLIQSVMYNQHDQTIAPYLFTLPQAYDTIMNEKSKLFDLALNNDNVAAVRLLVEQFDFQPNFHFSSLASLYYRYINPEVESNENQDQELNSFGQLFIQSTFPVKIFNYLFTLYINHINTNPSPNDISNINQLLLHVGKHDFDSIEPFNLLLQHNADINTTSTKDGQNILHYTSSFYTSSTKRVDFLITNGIDVNLTDNNGETILHKYITTTPNSYILIRQLLYKHNADITIVNKRNETFLHSVVLSQEEYTKDINDINRMMDWCVDWCVEYFLNDGK